jgi:succinate dehydrogenase/fumarate reductase-like Fe-S protein
MRINGRNRLACKTLIKDLDITSRFTLSQSRASPKLKKTWL